MHMLEPAKRPTENAFHHLPMLGLPGNYPVSILADETIAPTTYPLARFPDLAAASVPAAVHVAQARTSVDD